MRRSLLLALVVVVGWAHAVSAQSLFPNPGASTPPDEEPAVTPRPLQSGLKGFLYRYQLVGISSAFPLDLTNASAFVKIGGGADVTCTGTATPAAGQCGYVVGSGLDQNAVKVIYNGVLPALTVVKFWVLGVKTNAASNPASVAQVPFDTVENDKVAFMTAGSTRPAVTAGLVLDLSGSMGGAIAGGAGTRLAALKSASSLFLGLLKSLPPQPNDRVGAVYFSSTALPPNPLIAATDTVAVNSLGTEINGKNAGGATSIGDGLLKAQTLFSLAASPSPAGNTKSVLLFSDGEQNTDPKVAVAGAALNVGGAAYDATITRVCPITLGAITAPGNALMQDIANNRCTSRNFHVLNSTTAGPDLSLFFAQALADAYVGDKLEVSKVVSSVLTPKSTNTERFIVSRHDVFLKIALSWDVPRSLERQLAVSQAQGPRLRFRLEAPDGTLVDPTPFTTVDFAASTSVTSVPLPLAIGNRIVPHSGEWKLVLDGSFSVDVPYTVMILLDNATLASEFGASATDIGTGEPIKLRVHLTEGNNGIGGATVLTQIRGPKDGVGNILATGPTPAPAPPNTDPNRSPAQAKLAALEQDPATRGLFDPADLPALTLVDDGAHDDDAAGDGTYGVVFTGTLEEGHYQFRFGVVGSTPANQQFVRTYTVSVFVRPKADPAATVFTILSSTPAPGGKLVAIRATPKDRFGNFLGPDYVGHMNVVIAAGTVQTALSDVQNGSYDITYLLPKGASNPDVTLEVLGKPAFTRPLLGGVSLPYKFAAVVHLGATAPAGSFGKDYGSGVAIGGGVEMKVTPIVSVEGYLGHDRFSADALADGSSATHLSVQGRVTAPAGATRPFALLGIGVYGVQDLGSHFGWNIGAGVQQWFKPRIAFEGIYQFRQARLSGPDVNYSTVQGGLRVSF